MAFHIEKTAIEGLVILKPDVFGDNRGYFLETYSKKLFAGLGITVDFVQDNQSFSGKNTLRGLHFQKPPYAQGKLVTVLQGLAVDIAVDIRQKSPTFGKYLKVLLDADRPTYFYIPPGFAHGFAVLSETCLFAYKCTNYYQPAAEGGLLWNDPALGIDWQISEPLLSEKDKQYPALSELASPF